MLAIIEIKLLHKFDRKLKLYLEYLRNSNIKQPNKYLCNKNLSDKF